MYIQFVTDGAHEVMVISDVVYTVDVVYEMTVAELVVTGETGADPDGE